MESVVCCMSSMFVLSHGFPSSHPVQYCKEQFLLARAVLVDHVLVGPCASVL